MRRLFILTAISIVTLTGLSQNHASGYLGLRTGYIELEEVDDEGSWNLGVIGGLYLLPGLSLDASVDFQNADFLIFVSNIAISIPLERKTTALQAGMTFSPFYNNPFRPYVMGGLGYYYSHYSSDYYGSEAVGDAGYYAGFGADFLGLYNSEGLSLTVDARWFFTREEPYDQQKIEADGRMVSIGLKYKF